MVNGGWSDYLDLDQARKEKKVFLVIETALEILTKCRLFRNLSPAMLASLAKMGKLVRYSKGTMIFREGDSCPGVYVVADGVVRIFKIAPNGKEHVLHFADPGKTFAEVACIGGFNCPGFAEASEDCTCLLLPNEQFNKALQTDHQLCLKLMVGMSLWVRNLIDHLEDIVLRDAISRVAGYLVRHDPTGQRGEFALPTLKRDLASHLNLTSEALSRTLRRLAQIGLIAMPDQKSVRLVNTDALAEVAAGTLPSDLDSPVNPGP